MKLFIIFLFLLTSCSSLKEWTKDTFEPKSPMDDVHEYHRPLEKQHLIPRQGYEGYLTNRVCLKWYGDKCEKDSVKKYSLKDKEVRAKLISLQFACHIGGKRWRICPNKEGFCRREKLVKCMKKRRINPFRSKKKCVKWKTTPINKFIPLANYQFLLDSSTECEKGY